MQSHPPRPPDGWARFAHTADVRGKPTTHDCYRRGEGPGVVVIHEAPGLTSGVIALGQELVDAGYTVVLPHLFGRVDVAFSPREVLRSLPGICVSAEFNKLRMGASTPVAGWLRSLARDLHAELGGPGVGAIGMCFTGGFALAMAVDPATVAPVVAQPSVPFPAGKRRGAAIELSPADLATVQRRCAEGRRVLGIRYAEDPATGTRFNTLAAELGEAFVRVELPGEGHSTLTEQRSQVAVDAVLSFLRTHLRG